jgi:glycosyltransferase involved in cell wall biosynthesis
VELVLLGAPGRSSAAGEAWLQGARTRAITHALSFSGTLAPQDLANALAACEIMLFADAAGPSSRKTTLAASLASGRAVVAIDGPLAWSELIEAQAARMTAASPDALADALEELLADEGQRDALGERGRAFAERRMGVARSARVLAGLLDDVLTARSSVNAGVPPRR